MSTDGKRVCVYCGQAEYLTNEHVFPDCLQKGLDIIGSAKTPNGDKAIASAQKIHDVCASCNSGSLSTLDAYICKLNNRYFRTIVNAGDCIIFNYDFDLLLRGLLKIGYNVARSRKWPSASLENVRSYILGNSPRPPGYHVFLQLMIPSRNNTEFPVTPGTTKIPPIPLHASLENVSTIAALESARSLLFWSYRFCIVHEDFALPRSDRRRAKAEWQRRLGGAFELSERGSDSICASRTTVLEVYQSNTQFRHQVRKARELKSSIDVKKAKSKSR